jgi:hypothetical protein
LLPLLLIHLDIHCEAAPLLGNAQQLESLEKPKSLLLLPDMATTHSLGYVFSSLSLSLSEKPLLLFLASQMVAGGVQNPTRDACCCRNRIWVCFGFVLLLGKHGQEGRKEKRAKPSCSSVRTDPKRLHIIYLPAA